jgi:hypothetical protein
MLNLRGRLEKATDPEEIQRITQQIQGYVSQALGMAPDNKENRDKLLDILGDIDSISAARLDTARDEVKARDEKSLGVQQLMLDELMKITNALVDKPKKDDENGGVTTSPGDGDDNKDNPDDVVNPVQVVPPPGANSTDDVIAYLQDMQATSAVQMRFMTEAQNAMVAQMNPEAYAAAFAKALSGMSFVAINELTGEVDEERLFTIAANRTILQIRENPDSIHSITGN